jgi:LysM repeat protein
MSLKDFKIVAIISCFVLVSLSLAGQEAKTSSNFIYHAVEKKETIYSIAKEHGVTPEDIYRYNPTTKESVKIGQVLQIPQKNQKKDPPQSKEILYKVGKGESLYFIAKKFNCTQEDILRLNPNLATSSIKKGMFLKVPNPNFKPADTDLKTGNQTYQIQKGDTYFNLKKRFGIEKEDLEKLNPELKGGLKEGLTVKIPEKGNTTSPAQNQKDLKNQEILEPVNKSNKQQYNVGLYLPFRSELSDSAKLSAQTTNYLEFYEGAMIAAGDLKNGELNLKLFVYDTHQDPKTVEQLVKKPEFLSLDLIIGPVYPECQKIISDLSGKNHIPMVSPLSSDSRFVSGNGYYYQVNPDRKIRQSGTADYIIKEFQGKNILYLGNNNGNAELTKLKQHIGSETLHQYDLWSDNRTGIENHLDPEKENIVVLTDPDEARVSVAVTRLNTVAKKFRILLVGLQEYTRMQSINTEYLHNLNLHYLSPYYIDYRNKNVLNFIEKYRNEFGAEPSQYAFQGYDVLTGFLKGMRNSNKKFIPDTSGLLQAFYNFQRVSAFGGFVNTNFFVIAYTDTYEVICTGKLMATL